MKLKSLSYALTLAASLIVAQQASAADPVALLPYPSGHIGYASVERDIFQDASGRNSSTETLIGSVRAPSGAAMANASAHIKGDVRVNTRAENSVTKTRVGSIDSDNSFLAPSPKGANMRADADIERDVRIDNMYGRNNVMTTDIGSVSNADASASASARIRGSVEHRVSGDNTVSNLSVGSVAGAPRFVVIPGPF